MPIKKVSKNTEKDASSEEIIGKLRRELDEARELLARERQRIDSFLSSEERLHTAQQTASIGTFEWNLKTGKFVWTPELEILYGHKPGTMKLDETWSKFVHEHDRDRVSKLAQHAAETGEDFHSEFRIRWPDNSIHHLSARAQIFRDTQGKPERMVGINTDITDRKQVERNLLFLAEASKTLSSSLDYQTTLNTVAQLAVPDIADWCAVDMLVNDQITLVAVAHKDPEKVSWARELRHKQPPNRDAPGGLPQVLRTGKSEFYPEITEELIQASTKDPKILKLIHKIGFRSLIIAPIFRGGKPIGGITFVTTETNRLYNQSDLAMAEELASRASLAIENAQLYLESQNAIGIRDDFISVASHELKTPVTSVKIFTQVLQKHFEQLGDHTASTYLNKMDKQINRLTELIYNLLDISKIQAGRIEFNEKLFDIDTLVRETVEVMQATTKHKLIIEGETHQQVFGDEDRLGQVLSNLISNALKYSPKAKKVIITLSSTEKEVTVSVRDYGIGISPQHLEKIFERFYRVFDNTDKTFPGLGIGLYISSEIVRRHHGTFHVESHQGKGSTFSFTLPLNSTEKSKGMERL